MKYLNGYIKSSFNKAAAYTFRRIYATRLFERELAHLTAEAQAQQPGDKDALIGAFQAAVAKVRDALGHVRTDEVWYYICKDGVHQWLEEHQISIYQVLQPCTVRQYWSASDR